MLRRWLRRNAGEMSCSCGRCCRSRRACNAQPAQSYAYGSNAAMGCVASNGSSEMRRRTCSGGVAARGIPAAHRASCSVSSLHHRAPEAALHMTIELLRAAGTAAREQQADMASHKADKSASWQLASEQAALACQHRTALTCRQLRRCTQPEQAASRSRCQPWSAPRAPGPAERTGQEATGPRAAAGSVSAKARERPACCLDLELPEQAAWRTLG